MLEAEVKGDPARMPLATPAPLPGEEPGYAEESAKLSLAADAATKSSSAQQSFAGQEVYRCKKCRQVVACQDNVQVHDQETGKSFKKRSKSSLCIEAAAAECTSIFVQPMKWMSAVQEGDVMGKLSCATCSARLGSFDWAGAQCSCGTWVVPAFQLQKSRIDTSRI